MTLETSTHSILCVDEIIAGTKDYQVVQPINILDFLDLVAKNAKHLKTFEFQILQLCDQVVSQV